MVGGGPDDVVARPDDVVARRTRARHRVYHSSPTHVALEGPYPPVTGPGPSIATTPRTSSPPLRGHAVSPAPGPECTAAVMEMLRQQQEMFRQQQEHENERYRLLIEIQRENSAGLKQLRRDMANSPRFSRRGTPTSTPVPAADDSPKAAPVRHPLRRILPSPPPPSSG